MRDDIAGWLLANGFEECVYQPFERRLRERRADDAPSANALFIRDRAFVAARLQDAPPPLPQPLSRTRARGANGLSLEVGAGRKAKGQNPVT